MSLNVGESQVHETTGTTVSCFIAINDLLLRVINRGGTKLDSSGGRDSSGCRESPAGTALSLVLDRGNFTFGNPIDNLICCCVALFICVVSVISSWGITGITLHVLEHLFGVIRHVIVCACGSGLWIGVMCFDCSINLLVSGLSHLVRSFG